MLWSIAWHRVRGSRLLTVAASVIVVLVAILVASAPIYADAVYVAGARHTLTDAPHAASNVEIVASLRGSEYPEADRWLSEHISGVPELRDATISRSAISDSHSIPGRPDGDLVLFSISDSIEQQASLIAGRWPSDETGGDVIEAVLSSSAAELLQLASGDQIQAVNRLDEQTTAVHVVGIYQPNDLLASYWFGDALLTQGVLDGSSFTTYGPFIVTSEVFADRFATRPVDTVWRVFPRHDDVTLSTLAPLRTSVQALESTLNDGAAHQYEVSTELPAIITNIESALLATRSGVLILTTQLALLALFALVSIAVMTVEQRQAETALLHARGAGTSQVFRLALSEALLLVLPGVLIAALIAERAVLILNHAGPLVDIGLTLEPSITGVAIALLVAVGVTCLLALALPSLFASDRMAIVLASRARRGSGGGRGWAVDLALLALAALGYLQLRRYRAPITESVGGRLNVDPILVAAPALGLLAGALLAVRAIPYLGKAIERFARRSGGLIPALGGWQIGRRSGRVTRATVLLILALGIGFFSTAYTHTWESSQLDQAGFQTGADLRVWPDRAGAAVPLGILPGGYHTLDGVTSAMPVVTHGTRLGESVERVDAIVLDSDLAAETVAFRDDLASDRFGDLMDLLSTRRPAVPGVPLPGETARLALDLNLTMQRLCEEGESQSDEGSSSTTGASTIPCFAPEFDWDGMFTQFGRMGTPSIVLRDAQGSYFKLRSDPIPITDEDASSISPEGTWSGLVEYQLAFDTGSGQAFTPLLPVELVSIELDVLAPYAYSRTGRLEITDILVTNVGDEGRWRSLGITRDDPDAEWNVLAGAAFPLDLSPAGARFITTERPTFATVSFETGATYSRAGVGTTVMLRPRGGESPEIIPVIVSNPLMEAAALRVGDILPVSLGGAERQVEIVGVVDAFPTIDPLESGVIIADYETVVATQVIQPGVPLTEPTEFWLSATDERSAGIVRELLDAPFQSNDVDSREQLARSLRTDPVVLGMIGALAAGFAVAIVFAVAGFTVASAMSMRERLVELGLIRALGVSPRQIFTLLLLENAFVVLLGLLVGTLLGLLLSWGILPLIALTQDAEQVFPSVRVIIPWGTIAVVQAAVLVVLIALSLVLSLYLRRSGLGRVLRIGED